MNEVMAIPKMVWQSAGLLLLVACVAVAAAGEQEDGLLSATPVVKVELNEWAIKVNRETVRSGVVAFEVSNRGLEEHEFVVIKSELPLASLPLVAGKVNEATAGEWIGEIEEIAPRTVYRASFTLAPGRYLFICNIVEKEPDGTLESHYHEGMQREFLVLP